jgi:heme/copper-type cytochrome/quinol oxidase subunit 3
MKKTLIALLLLTAATAAVAQAPHATETTATTTSQASTSTIVVGADASEIRNEFRSLLDRQPPQLGRVLKLDPALFNNPAYLASYPELAKFVADHPEIAHSPAYYLEGIYIGDSRPETASERVWRDAMEGISIFLVIATVVTVLSWIIKTLIDHRRWSRITKVQTDVHNKLLDRFATNEDLLQYIQTPAGKRFLESTPLQLDAGPRPPSAPANRILWSVQLGVVLVAAGIGLQVVSHNVQVEVVQPLSALGIVAISLGIGFVVSAVLSWVISRQLGLWSSPAEPSSSTNE